jgi:hypothetical protein
MPSRELVWIALLSAAGCGGSPRREERKAEPLTAEQLEQQRAWKEREELDKARPPSPMVEKRRLGFRTADRCGQGPYRVELESLSARYGESLEVYVCGPHAVAGAYRLTVKERYAQERSYERTYGYAADNGACVAGAEERAAVAGAAPEGAAAAAGKPSKTRGAPAKVAERERAQGTRQLDAAQVPEECHARTPVVEHGWSMEGEGVPLSQARITLELWSERPNDLAGAVFVVLQRAVADDMTPQRWAAYQEAARAWYERYRAFSDGELRSGRARIVDTTVKAPPPPPPRRETPPPRPSANATWVPGYWHFEDGEHHWLVGLWRVPPEDVKAEQTAEAPRPPPPPRQEVAVARAAAPSRRAVWTPGSWQWDAEAGVWVWIDGAWRIPPAQGQVWVPPKWEVRVGGGVKLRPGGWTIRIGR